MLVKNILATRMPTLILNIENHETPFLTTYGSGNQDINTECGYHCISSVRLGYKKLLHKQPEKLCTKSESVRPLFVSPRVVNQQRPKCMLV